MEELKIKLLEEVKELRANAKAVLAVAANTIPPGLKHLLSVPETKLESDLTSMLEDASEEEGEALLQLMLIGTEASKRAYKDLRESLDRRIQPEGEERAKPRKFKGFKKRRGTW
jgi:hypothetical protein